MFVQFKSMVILSPWLFRVVGSDSIYVRNWICANINTTTDSLNSCHTLLRCDISRMGIRKCSAISYIMQIGLRTASSNFCEINQFSGLWHERDSIVHPEPYSAKEREVRLSVSGFLSHCWLIPGWSHWSVTGSPFHTPGSVLDLITSKAYLGLRTD